MRVEIPPSLAEFVQEQVKAGRFRSASDAVKAGLMQLQVTTTLSGKQVKRLRKELDPALAEADAGVFSELTGEDVIRFPLSARAQVSACQLARPGVG